MKKLVALWIVVALAAAGAAVAQDIRYERNPDGSVTRLVVGGSLSDAQVKAQVAAGEETVLKLQGLRNIDKDQVRMIVMLVQQHRELFDSQALTWREIVDKAIIREQTNLDAMQGATREVRP